MPDLHPDADVLVLSESGDKIGTMRYRQARELARQQELDLVVISRQPNQTVCKIMDEGKWRYQQKKKQKQQHKKPPPLKEVKFGVSTAEHDIAVKMRHIREFVEKGCTVKIVIEMHGRERSHSILAKSKLEGIIMSLGETVRSGDVKTTPNCVFVTVQPTRTKHGEGNDEERASSSQQSATG